MTENVQYALLDCKDDVDFLIVNNLGLADYMANRFQWTGVEFDDLVQWARLGLIKAAKAYEPALGVKFSTYACKTMWGTILRAVYGSQQIPKRRIQPIMVSMEQKIDSYEDLYIGDIFANEEDYIEQCLNKVFLETLIEGMGEFELAVLNQRFVEEKTRREIGSMFGKSHEWIRQVELRCLEQMRIKAGC